MIPPTVLDYTGRQTTSQSVVPCTDFDRGVNCGADQGAGRGTDLGTSHRGPELGSRPGATVLP